MKNYKTIALIMGTGLWQCLPSDLLDKKEHYSNIDIIFGSRTGKVLYFEVGFYKDLRVILIPRHGIGNNRYRSPIELALTNGHEAHIWLLHSLGVDQIYAFNSVGALNSNIPLANTNTFIIPNQLSYGFGTSVHSFLENALYPHPEMNNVFSEKVRKNIIYAIDKSNASFYDSGVYIYNNLDHLETKVESLVLRKIYEDVDNAIVGSTAGPELVLSKEMGLSYATLCAVTNYLDPYLDKEVTHLSIKKIADEIRETLTNIVSHILEINLN